MFMALSYLILSCSGTNLLKIQTIKPKMTTSEFTSQHPPTENEDLPHEYEDISESVLLPAYDYILCDKSKTKSKEKTTTDVYHLLHSK